jgi:hypothetical protein
MFDENALIDAIDEIDEHAALEHISEGLIACVIGGTLGTRLTISKRAKKH